MMMKKMKIYRASYRDNFSEHKGYEYFSNKAVAEKSQTQNNKERYEDYEEASSQMFDEVTELTFTLSKKGILDLLNIHCSYPDNG